MNCGGYPVCSDSSFLFSVPILLLALAMEGTELADVMPPALAQLIFGHYLLCRECGHGIYCIVNITENEFNSP
jgi:hypothetical protein